LKTSIEKEESKSHRR